MNELSIRRALHGEAELLTEIADAAKRHWGYPEHWIAQWKEALTITPDLVAEHPVYSAVRTGEVLGFYMLQTDGQTSTLEHLWIRPECIGQGVGRALFEHAVRIAAAAGANVLLIDSDPHTEGFYQRMGARRVAEIPADVQGVARVLPRLLLPLRAATTPGMSSASPHCSGAE